jgi:hypothetical protein
LNTPVYLIDKFLKLIKPLRQIPRLMLRVCILECLMLVLGGCLAQLSRTDIHCQIPAQNAAAPLLTPTYDGSGETVEPTVVEFARNWHGFRYWMAISPYPNSQASFENPSILASTDGVQWQVPPGLANPVAVASNGTLADATIVYDPRGDELWLYYLNDVPGAAGTNQEYLLRITSKDGVHWDSPRVLLGASDFRLTSPSIVNLGATYHLWNVEAGAAGCASTSTRVLHRISQDGVVWSTPEIVDLSAANYVVWHLNVSKVAQTNELIIADTAYPTGSGCGFTRLFYANSWDGVVWSVPAALLSPGQSWDSWSIYRSSLVYDHAQSELRIWYSAQGPQGWHTGYSQVSCAPI